MCQSQEQQSTTRLFTWKGGSLTILFLVLSTLMYGQTTARKGAAVVLPTSSPSGILAVPPGLVTRGVPPLPEAASVPQAPYQNMYGLPFII